VSSTGATALAKRVAQQLEKTMPKLVTSTMTRSLRAGKVFLDWSQNNGSKTTIRAVLACAAGIIRRSRRHAVGKNSTTQAGQSALRRGTGPRRPRRRSARALDADLPARTG